MCADWIPVVSQLKSFCQFVTGDVDGAARTQANFVRECPVVSQSVALGQYVAGDEKGAKETWDRGVGTISNVANGIPVVGHVKGVIHHAAGDHEGGNRAFNAATRTSVVIASGAAAGIATGGLAAIPAGIAAGSTYDITQTLITDKPAGVVAAWDSVVNNPSAGTIFDAVTAHAGDGLAGYSGGQIGNKVVTMQQLSKLENIRAAKLDQLNNGMFSQGGNGMTSGQVTALGSEINSITSQINSITQGSPQWWYDPKTNTIGATKPNSVTAVPIVGNIPDTTDQEDGRSVEERREAQRQMIIRVYQMQEEAFKYDLYSEGPTDSLSKADKKASLNAQNSKQPSGSMYKAYPNMSVVKEEQLRDSKDRIKQKFNEDPTKKGRKAIEQLNQPRWIHVPMFTQCPFTGLAMLSNARQGILHTFLRHSNQWMQFIPEIGPIWQRLRPIHQLLLNIRQAPDETAASRAVQALETDLRNLPDSTFAQIIADFNEIQHLVYKRIRQTTESYGQYLGNGTNGAGRQQMFFLVRDSAGRDQVMVVCVSDDLYPPVTETLPDRRPVRLVITAYFIPYDNDFKNKKLIEKSFP